MIFQKFFFRIRSQPADNTVKSEKSILSIEASLNEFNGQNHIRRL